MVRNKFLMSAAVAAGLLVGFAGAGTARAATILDFEGGGADGGEGLVNSNYVVGTFGATSGMYADDATISTSANSGTIFDIGTVNGSAAAGSPAATHYAAINAGLAETAPIQLSFDLALNTANVTTNGYFQITLIGNSGNGYFQDGYGSLINGYNIEDGLALSASAVAQGATLTTTTPLANGISAYHFTIPVSPTFVNGSTPTFGNGGSPGDSGFYQLSLITSGGYAGTALVGLDNVQIGAIPTVATPEPASLGLLGLAIPALLRRRRQA